MNEIIVNNVNEAAGAASHGKLAVENMSAERCCNQTKRAKVIKKPMTRDELLSAAVEGHLQIRTSQNISMRNLREVAISVERNPAITASTRLQRPITLNDFMLLKACLVACILSSTFVTHAHWALFLDFETFVIIEIHPGMRQRQS